EGKFGLGQKVQLRILANTLGQDIARFLKTPIALCHDCALPDHLSQMLRHEVTVWLYLALSALECLRLYLALDSLMGKDLPDLA
ncbi:DotU family type IV/VI secretion system protein, partial [Pseudomonas syringae pv. tagetis]